LHFDCINIPSINPISNNSTLLFNDTPFCIEPETSHAINTRVVSSNPFRFLALRITASSNAFKIMVTYSDFRPFTSRYAERNLNGNCFELATAFSFDKKSQTFLTCAWNVDAIEMQKSGDRYVR